MPNGIKSMKKEQEVKKPANWFESLNCAIEGIIYAFKTQRHMRLHYITAAGALFISVLLELPMLEFALFSLSVVILLFAEMMNTAVEEAVNLIEERHHIFARNAKDVSAGAVLISSIGVWIMLYVIFSKYLYQPMGVGLRDMKTFSGHIAVISLLLVLISVVAFKATIGRGTPLHGGMPSGHSAIAFSLFTAITLLTLNPVVTLLALGMAVMVGHARLEAGIHTRFEVALGSLLGLGLTLLVFKIFFMIS